jgi:hypothetical protein
MRFGFVLALVTVGLCSLAAAPQSASSTVDSFHRAFDQILDVYVRDGFVYYNALKRERERLDGYVASLDSPAALAQVKGSPEQQIAFWINAYNALVLRTVIDHYPIRGKAPAYPPDSIRQVSGAFERRPHRVAGKSVTLDVVEKDYLVPLGDARAFLALGRGSVGGGRLRSEAFDAARLEGMLDSVRAESVTRKEIIRVDAGFNELHISPIFSWREAVFVTSFAEKANKIFNQRSDLERAVLAFIEPHLVGSEADFLQQNAFYVRFSEHDWHLNDLATRTP